MLWGQSTTKDHIRAEHKLHSISKSFISQVIIPQVMFFEPIYIPWALNAGTCIRHGDLFYSAGLHRTPQWGAADAEIKVPSGENTELKRSPFKAWSRSVYNHTCYAYCQGFLPCLFLPFRSIHLHFFQNLSQFSLCWLFLTNSSCIGPQNKIGHSAGGRL